jgi:hypothetical protein
LAGDDRGASSKKGKRRKKEGQGLGIELLTLRTGVVFVVALPHPPVFFTISILQAFKIGKSPKRILEVCGAASSA